MTAFRVFLARVLGLFRRDTREAELHDEIQDHLALLAAEHERLGLSADAARDAARRAFGGVEQTKDAYRDQRGLPFVETLAQDLRYACRTFRRSPGFTAVVVLSLAVGIGGNAAMFSVMSAVLIQPLPYHDADRLVRAVDDGYFPPGGLVALQQESRTMEMAGYNRDVDLNLTGQGEALRLTGCAASANLFAVLGATAAVGRVFAPGEDRAGQDNAVILSHAIWTDTFGSDPTIVGRVITLGGAGRKVVGVMPPGFAFPDTATQFWIPLHLDPRDQAAHWFRGFMPLIGRLRPGATLTQAQGEIRSLTRHVATLFPYPMGRNWNAAVTVLPLQQVIVSDVRTRLILLQSAVGLVLLIACVNVAGLLLSRGTARQKEIAVRTALGAGRGRIVRQLLAESALLAFAGGALGLALAVSSFSVLTLALPGDTPGVSQLVIGGSMVTSVGLLSALTGIAFGLVPAISASGHALTDVIKAGGQRARGTVGTRLRRVLITGEVALAVVLAVGAGLLIKSLWQLTQVNPGFAPQQVFTLRVSPNPSLCRERAACIGLYDELLRRTLRLSGVREAAAANALPMAGAIPALPVVVDEHPYAPADHLAPMFWAGAVTPAYFHVMRIPILEGRAFTDGDAEKSERVLIVSQAMARRYWPGESAIGKHIRPVFEGNSRTVVGVAGDVRQYDLANHSPDYIAGDMYMPYPQSVGNDRQLPAAMTLVVRTDADASALPRRIRELVNEVNPNVPVSDIRTLESVVNDSAQASRSLMWLFVGFAGTALALAAIGTYGVMSYSIAQRTFELGMRAALGATRRDIFGLVLGESLRLGLVGIVLGVAASLAVTRVLNAFLYQTAATDPVILLAVCGLLVAVAMAAGYIPARRAASVDPLAALRVE